MLLAFIFSLTSRYTSLIRIVLSELAVVSMCGGQSWKKGGSFPFYNDLSRPFPQFLHIVVMLFFCNLLHDCRITCYLTTTEIPT